MKHFSRGVFTVSIDYEFAWGYVDQNLSSERLATIRKEVDIVERLIALFEKYKIPATWAIVGHLLNKPEDMSQSNDCAWFDVHGLVSRISNAPTGHEIASHSYAHILYGDARTTHEQVCHDIKMAQKIHQAHGLSFDSFIFPRNSEGYYGELYNQGIKIYRGTTSRWYMGFPKTFRRFFRLLDYYLPAVPVVEPRWTSNGLLCIPDSLLFLSREGVRRFVLPFFMKRKIRKGLYKAVAQKKILHIWFHPSNFSYDTEVQFCVWEEILKEVALLRDAGMLDVLTMKKIYATLQ